MNENNAPPPPLSSSHQENPEVQNRPALKFDYENMSHVSSSTISKSDIDIHDAFMFRELHNPANTDLENIKLKYPHGSSLPSSEVLRGYNYTINKKTQKNNVKRIKDGYLVDQDGNKILDENNNPIPAKKKKKRNKKSESVIVIENEITPETQVHIVEKKKEALNSPKKQYTSPDLKNHSPTKEICLSSKQHESKQKESKQHESKQKESKQKESKQKESKQKESKQKESKQHESKQHESKQHESKQHESKQHESKQKESKQQVSKKHESKQKEEQENEYQENEYQENEEQENEEQENEYQENEYQEGEDQEDEDQEESKIRNFDTPTKNIDYVDTYSKKINFSQELNNIRHNPDYNSKTPDIEEDLESKQSKNSNKKKKLKKHNDDNAEEKTKKQIAFAKLQKLKGMGIKLSRDFKDDDDLDTMLLELELQTCNKDIIGNTWLLQESLKASTFAVHWINDNLLNGKLALRGNTNYTEQFSNFINSNPILIERLSRMMNKGNKPQNPIKQLVWAWGVSIAKTHFENTMSGTNSSSNQHNTQQENKGFNFFKKEEQELKQEFETSNEPDTHYPNPQMYSPNMTFPVHNNGYYHPPTSAHPQYFPGYHAPMQPIQYAPHYPYYPPPHYPPNYYQPPINQTSPLKQATITKNGPNKPLASPKQDNRSTETPRQSKKNNNSSKRSSNNSEQSSNNSKQSSNNSKQSSNNSKQSSNNSKQSSNNSKQSSNNSKKSNPIRKVIQSSSHAKELSPKIQNNTNAKQKLNKIKIDL